MELSMTVPTLYLKDIRTISRSPRYIKKIIQFEASDLLVLFYLYYGDTIKSYTNGCTIYNLRYQYQ